jgi:hypothetical protein
MIPHAGNWLATLERDRTRLPLPRGAVAGETGYFDARNKASSEPGRLPKCAISHGIDEFRARLAPGAVIRIEE